MSEYRNDSHCMARRISRRAALGRTALALGAATAAAVARGAAAQSKLTQAIAKYQPTPNGADHCGLCVNFQPPNACRFVAGEISPNGWCQLYAAKT